MSVATLAPPAVPRVAVVIPCFDDGATLRDALASLAHQEPCELVIVNDGSTDRPTLELLHELAYDGYHVIHQRNRGTSAARMTGVWATSAPFVFPLDADDAVLPGALAALADTLEARPRLAAAWGNVALFGELERRERQRAATLDPWRITYFNNIPYASLMRREPLLAVGGWSLPGAFQDWDLWMALAEAGYEGAGIDAPVLYYRLHGTRQFARGAARHAERYAILRSRHARLFAARRRNWRRSAEPWRVRVGLPLATAIPGLPQRQRHRLFTLADAPSEALDHARVRLARR
ncbi:MAG: glycosyltransferase family 2 protein [Thermoleophilaceae bacterium]|nr:glycosyltransferase family 2 protein [Thermoleophilaceae bacterium]